MSNTDYYVSCIIVACSASYGRGAPPILSNGEKLDSLHLERDPAAALNVHKIAANIGDAASQYAIAVSLTSEIGEKSSSNDLTVLYEV